MRLNVAKVAAARDWIPDGLRKLTPRSKKVALGVVGETSAPDRLSADAHPDREELEAGGGIDRDG
jgi:hypothetical protein